MIKHRHLRHNCYHPKQRQTSHQYNHTYSSLAYLNNTTIQLNCQHLSMGICNKKASEPDRPISTRAILQTDTYDQMQFYFTTEHLLRIDADCLIIYCDDKMNLQKNVFIQKIGKFETRKIKEFAESHIKTTKAQLVHGRTIFFPISIAALQFSYIGMVCLKVWDGKQKIKSNLQEILNQLFQTLHQRRVQSVAITQFNEQFGIPAQAGCKMLAQALRNSSGWLKIVTIICNDSEKQSFYMEKIIKYKDGDELSSKLSQDKSSNYY